MSVFGKWKKMCSSKFVKLELLLIRERQDYQNDCAVYGSHCINSFISIFLDPIQKRAPARSVQLEAVYLEALLYPSTTVPIISL